MKILKLLFVTIFSLVLFSCNSGEKNGHKEPVGIMPTEDHICLDPPVCLMQIGLVPMDGITEKQISTLEEKLKKNLYAIQNKDSGIEDFPYYYEISVLPHENSPETCLNEAKTRFRATKLVDYLKIKYGDSIKYGYYIIGVTNKDISTSVHGKDDYGILGLSYKPGDVSVISTYRLKNIADLWKLAVHEYGHGKFKMDHCPRKDPYCLMKDAEGKNPNFGIKKTFCDSCMNKYAALLDF